MKRSIVSVPVRRVGLQPSGKAPSNMSDQDLLAVEEPLQIRLDDRDLAITMRTPGNDEELAVGFLFTEGILPGRDAIAPVARGDNSITVTTAGEASIDLSAQKRHFYLTSSCGVCGKASVDALVSGRLHCPAPRPGAPSSLAVETAMRFGMTLAGFVRDGRFNIYSGADRIIS